MALFSFFNSAKNQKYQYIPRYWDPIKEKREERQKYLNSRDDNSAEAIKERLSQSGFKRGYVSNPGYRKERVARSNKVLLGVLAMIMVVIYYFIYYYLPKFVESIEGSESLIN